MKVCNQSNCPRAGQPQPFDAFNASKYTADGRRGECHFCSRRASKEARARKAAKYVEPTAKQHISNVQPTLPAVKTEPVPEVPVAPPAPVVPVFDPAVTSKERREIARLKTELDRSKALLREAEKDALSSESLRALIGSLDAPNVTADPEWLKGASSPRSVTGTPVLFISDIHYDEVVRKEQIGGSNEYNREIAKASLRNTFVNATKLLKGFMARPKYDGIVIPLGGDMVSGNIHEELVETNEAPIALTLMALEEDLIEGLGGMADEFGKVHVPCVVGNHGRMHKKPRAKNRAFESFEYMLYQRLAAYFKSDSRLTFDIPDGPDAFFSVYSTRICLTHGDQFRGGDGIGGIMVPIMRGVSKKQVKQQAIGDAFDLVMMGHWHQYIHTTRLVINGSVKGYDEYANQNNFSFEHAQQALFVMHPEIGCTFRMPVMCRKEA